MKFRYPTSILWDNDGRVATWWLFEADSYPTAIALVKARYPEDDPTRLLQLVPDKWSFADRFFESPP